MPSAARSFGGPTQSLIGYTQAALSEGASVDIAAPRVKPKDEVWLRDMMPDAMRLYFGNEGASSVAAAPAMMNWLRRSGSRYDVIHVHGLFNPVSSLAMRLCLQKKWPLVVRPFGTLSKYTFSHRKAWLKKRYFQMLDRPGLERAPGVHFTTDAERNEANWHGIDFSVRAHVVPPPFAQGQHEEVATPGKDSFNVLFLSRLHPKKNIESLLDAWPRVLEHVPGARLTIAGKGEGEYVRSLKKRSYQLGCGQVKFAGFVEGEAKKALLADSDLFVLPSFQENFGVAVMEALAAGLPVVITPEVQLAAFVEKHELGRVVSSDPIELADSIRDILMTPAFRRYCRVAGPKCVDMNFSVSAVGRQLMAMYKSTIDSRN